MSARNARKLFINAPGEIVISDFELEDFGPKTVRTRSVISGISHGTEMTGFLGTNPFITRTITPERVFADRSPAEDPFYPWRWAGYESVGVVEEAGPEAAGFRVGERVWLAKPHQSAHAVDGTATEMLALSDNISDEEAIFINLGTVALCAANDAEIKLGDVVAVFGGGVVGQLAVQMALLAGARRVFLIEPSQERRDLAKNKCGAETLDPREEDPAAAIHALLDKSWPDVVIECSGTVRGLRGAIAAAGLAGTVIAAGFYAGGTSDLSLGEEFLHNRVTLKASMHVWGCPSRFPNRWNRARTLKEVWHLLDQHKLDVSGFVTGRFPFEEAQRAFEAVHAQPDKYFKIALEY